MEQRAEVGPRAVAALIDGALLAVVVGIPLLIIFGQKVANSTGSSTSTSYSASGPLVPVIWSVIALCYFTVFEKVAGATIGKGILHLRVRQLDGTPITWRAAALRNVFRYVDGLPYVLPYLVGALTIWNGNRAQRVGDVVVGTVVLHRGTVDSSGLIRTDLGAQRRDIPRMEETSEWQPEDTGDAFERFVESGDVDQPSDETFRPSRRWSITGRRQSRS